MVRRDRAIGQVHFRGPDGGHDLRAVLRSRTSVVVDPEAARQFLQRIFDVEGIELVQRPCSTFKDMVDSLHEAEKLGVC